MKVGTLVVYPNAFGDAYLGRLDQPVITSGGRRWTVEWLDHFIDDPTETYPESSLLKVIPQ